MTIDYLNPTTNFYHKEDAGARNNRPSTGTKVHTETIRALITTDDYEIEGNLHIKPGGYQSRISDLLNIKELHYVPITEATFRKLDSPDEQPRQAKTLIIKLDSIKMVVPLDERKQNQPQGPQG
jgi:hypothetical protein